MRAETNDRPSSGSVDWIRTVTTATFEEQVLDAEGPVVAEFMSYGCSYCRALEPVLQRVAETLEPTEPIFRVNAPVERGLAASYHVRATPTLVMFLGGREMGRVVAPEPTMSTVLAAVTRPFEV
jgi:thioredoxin 1